MPERPTNLDVSRGRRTETEVQAAVVHRQVRRLTQDFLRLLPVAVKNSYPRPNRAAVRTYARQLHLQPMVVTAHVIAQQRRRLIVIHDDDVHVAVVIEVAESAAPAGL